MSLTYDQISTSSKRHSTESESRISMRTDTTWRYSVFGPERLGRGAMLFTGPDGIRDHRQRVDAEHRYVGEGTMSPEGSSETAYLWRASSGAPHPRPKSKTVGEVGWGVPEHAHWFSSDNTGAQIKLGEFRQAAEDRHTHLYQNPWYLQPHFEKLAESVTYVTSDMNVGVKNPNSLDEANLSPNRLEIQNDSIPNASGQEDENTVLSDT